ncbi:sensor histidine kinase [Spirosoma utsteinense]|uniref:sensor histidine kinase n=1 Tax=Spirosoma utsteinense TaxID=2585773 RepID=UPI001646010C|nr:HAMP domain-containing sensor histidine kinase [Spirosoma utsteinense]MBC3787777.1 signal transduction histidine kinase [Spirosoma utsteinense]
MKLLDRTLRTYLGYSIVVMLSSTPVFYVVIERLFIDDVDEALIFRKQTIQRQLGRFANEKALVQWHDLEGNTLLRRVDPKTPARDSIYDTVYPEQIDPVTTEPEPFRELSARLQYRGRPLQLITRISLVESEDLLQAIVLTQASLLSLLLVGFVLLNRRSARRLWQPFYGTLEQLRRFEVDKNESLALPPSGIDEFAELNQTLGVLTNRSHQAYLGQKEFTENAAHEMQTPLAIVQSKLERLAQTQPLTDEQTGLIGTLSGVTVRLSRLNKSLLLLARIENQPVTEVGPVNLSALLNALLTLSAESIQAKGLHLKRTGLDDGPIEQTNRALLDILLSNLLVNAIRYTQPGGTITIDVQRDRLTIANIGEPLTIPPDKLFDRFQRGETGAGGVGLGLAIARKIAEASGYSLTYHFAQGQHKFSLTLG